MGKKFFLLNFFIMLFLITQEVIFIENSNFFLGLVGFLSLWFVYCKIINLLEVTLNQSINNILEQFIIASRLNSMYLKLFVKVNFFWKKSLQKILPQFLTIIVEMSELNLVNAKYLVTFFDLVLVESFIFTHYVNLKVKYFLNKIPSLGIII